MAPDLPPRSTAIAAVTGRSRAPKGPGAMLARIEAAAATLPADVSAMVAGQRPGAEVTTGPAKIAAGFCDDILHGNAGAASRLRQTVSRRPHSNGVGAGRAVTPAAASDG